MISGGTDARRILLFSRVSGKLSLQIDLAGAKKSSVRLSETHLTASDDRGRVIGVDLQTAYLARNVRV